jgi:hypothetical protein
MPRVVIYPSAAPTPEQGGAIHFGGPGGAGQAEVSAVAATDKYADKLVKFVPAEVVAFFAPIASLVRDRPALLVTAGLVGLAATPAYLVVAARQLPRGQRPPLHYYVLSSIAFIAWALGTSGLGALAGLDATASGFTLGVTVLLIPLADAVLTRNPATPGPGGS